MDLGLGRERWNSPKFMTVCNWFEASLIEEAYRVELAILMLTPGFTFWHMQIFFGWDMHGNKSATDILAHEPTLNAARPYVSENLLSIQAEDGLWMIRTILEARGFHKGSVPLWVTMWINERLRRGDDAKAIAEEIGKGSVTAAKVRAWGRANQFDPLTGVLLDPF